MNSTFVSIFKLTFGPAFLAKAPTQDLHLGHVVPLLLEIVCFVFYKLLSAFASFSTIF